LRADDSPVVVDGYLLDTEGNPEDPKYLYWNLSV
jgi:hypothetical protein